MSRYIVKLSTGTSEGLVDFAATDDLAEALQYALRQAFAYGVQDVQIHDSEEPSLILICERV